MNSNLIPAPLWRQLAAIFYDSLLLIASYFMVGGIYVAISAPLGYFQDPTNGFTANSEILPATLLQFTLFPLLVGFTLFFFCYFWMQHGRTLGMQTWKLVMVPTHRESIRAAKPTLLECLTRLGIATLSIACFGLGYWWSLWDSQQKTWQDRGSKTRIYYCP